MPALCGEKTIRSTFSPISRLSGYSIVTFARRGKRMAFSPGVAQCSATQDALA
jgi:hypothetical protein